jgi:hypothetical protein
MPLITQTDPGLAVLIDLIKADLVNLGWATPTDRPAQQGGASPDDQPPHGIGTLANDEQQQGQPPLLPHHH